MCVRGTVVGKLVTFAVGVTLLAVYSSTVESQTRSGTGTVLFEGARLITGEDGPPIETSAFIVQNSRFTRVGKKGEISLPPGALRVDLTGKTVVPGIVDAHGHLGFLDMVTGTMSKVNFTRENYVDHLQRYAYHGVAATISTGTDMGDLAYRLRIEVIPDASRILTVGLGLAWPGSGPFDPSRNDVPYPVTTVAEARKAVQDVARHKPDFVKIWVDDRNGRQKKLTPDLYQAAADEARKHNIRSIGHVFTLDDAKGLVRAGVEGFLHSIRDREVDDEYIALAKEHNIWITPNLGGTNRLSLIRENGTPEWFDDPLVGETIAPALIRERAKTYQEQRQARGRQGGGGGPAADGGSGAGRTGGAAGAGAQPFDIANTRRLHAAGVRQVLGSDTAGDNRRWIGMMTLVEIENMVSAGFTPAEAIVASTRESAKVLRLNELGTVAAGKSADFIVLDANPLENIANLRRIKTVYLRGHEVDRAGLRAKWRAQWTAAHMD